MRGRAQPWEIAPILGTAAVVGYLVVSRLALLRQATIQPVSALLSQPPGWFWIPVAVLGLTLAGAALAAALRGWDGRPARAFYVFGALTLFAQLFVLPDLRLPPTVSADELAAISLERVATRLARGASAAGLPVNSGEVQQALEGLAPPPYTEQGRPVPGWHIVVRPDCQGPQAQPAGLTVGTVVYCLNGARRQGWLTFVGSGGRETGPADMGRRADGSLIVVPLRAAPGE